MTDAPIPPDRATWVLPLVAATPQAILLILLFVGIGYDLAGREPGLLVKAVVAAMVAPPLGIAYSNYRRRARLVELAELAQAHEALAQLSGAHHQRAQLALEEEKHGHRHR